ncbi:ADP-dependent (S)-NAD(P)H-hydrate dehydratase [Weissella viridescens]|uniref:ADP-dependent (S)-NAD(P)H-hydrate dehydratase n=1 Tax=Weissella viridescens TaxID=1629 RepID=A0A380P6Y7_WEIVI|nr:ADP-dependent (S)-NAD(P)H-hydrate dehydratase [Weissella viridescens]
MGSGMGLTDYAVSLVKRVLMQMNAKQVLVADGSALTIVANEHLSFPRDTYTVITPHQMEWARLSNIQLNYQDEIELNDVQRSMLNVDVLVLKQHHTMIYNNEGQQQSWLADHISQSVVWVTFWQELLPLLLANLS